MPIAKRHIEAAVVALRERLDRIEAERQELVRLNDRTRETIVTLNAMLKACENDDVRAELERHLPDDHCERLVGHNESQTRNNAP